MSESIPIGGFVGVVLTLASNGSSFQKDEEQGLR